MIASGDSVGHVEGHGISLSLILFQLGRSPFSSHLNLFSIFLHLILFLMFSPIFLHLILFSAPPDSISIQSVGGLAIRPGGLLTVTEDVISQVTSLVI